jgi:hypothetical protein
MLKSRLSNSRITTRTGTIVDTKGFETKVGYGPTFFMMIPAIKNKN